MQVHFIAIGGAVMHNLAIALHQKGYTITGSDDEIREPSRSRLARYHLLPETDGWFPEKIHAGLDAIILGMHARADNPELLYAQELGLKVYSFPEYLYLQTQHKTRVVVAGSHGKTTTTAMIMHVLRQTGHKFDYMVGSQLDGFETMVGLSDDAPIAIFEGDEYLSSPIDRRPKFLWYKPHTSIITGIAWDHINVFPSFAEYKQQFAHFVTDLAPDSKLFFYANDRHMPDIIENNSAHIVAESYIAPPFSQENGRMIVSDNEGDLHPLHIFGQHNAENAAAAAAVCATLGISNADFWKAMESFRGTARRLQRLAQSQSRIVYLDFAHAPSKLKATVQAVRNLYPGKQLIAAFELHTFSSLNAHFLKEYAYSMEAADEALVFYDPHTIAHKKLPDISAEQIAEAFVTPGLKVFTKAHDMQDFILEHKQEDAVLLLMSSGVFSGISIPELANSFVL